MGRGVPNVWEELRTTKGKEGLGDGAQKKLEDGDKNTGDEREDRR